MTTSAIKPLGGVPALFVNGTAQPGLAYITYLPERDCYADFAAGQHGPAALVGAGTPGGVQRRRAARQPSPAHYLAIHATTAGRKCLRLDTTRHVTPLLDLGIPFTGDDIVLTLGAFETRLFRLD